jgi:hypothetical protein
MSLNAIGFVDVFDLAASLRPRLAGFETVEPGRRLLQVRFQDTETGKWMRQHWSKWPELRNTVDRLERLAKALYGGEIERGRIYFEMIDPGASSAWLSEDIDYDRVHVPIRTNPTALVYVGIECAHLHQGNVTPINPRIKGCATNFGEWSRIHLILDARRAVETQE